MATKYSFKTAGEIVSGIGSLKQAGALLKSQGIGTVGVITDPNLVQMGLVRKLESVLQNDGIRYTLYPVVTCEPSLKNVEGIIQSVKKTRWEALIGFGGGSSLDVAKLVAVSYANPGPPAEFIGIDQIKNRGIPTMLIPTTSGTGSEVTPNSIVTLTDEGRKAGAVSSQLFARWALLDPELTLGKPASLTASTGFDAMIHSLESYIGLKANAISDMFSLEGIRLITSSLRTACSEPGNLMARENMMFGSTFGGMALTAAGTAAVHALAYSIGAKYGISHGVSNSMLLIPVLRFSFEACLGRLSDIAEVMGVAEGSPEANAHSLMRALGELIIDLKIPTDLISFGGKPEHLDELAEAASKVTRLLDNNPKSMSVGDIRLVFASIMGVSS